MKIQYGNGNSCVNRKMRKGRPKHELVDQWMRNIYITVWYYRIPKYMEVDILL